ncbi:HAUS augmin-like complex subunit 3 isoform X2 [Conger conger]|uniref:HAUS augmin-like complex subunit 3 isoform X2 n=1 Tax=Conger conger TaxID=82655 RepID=UPI002A59E4CD|nr:HAUS augmin-like complex subunit 3 isoform X2 [Conger conger]
MLDGGRFVEAVARLGYPGASALKGEDFDWLFDTPEHQHFLRFLCNTVNENNVLTAEEVRSFRALRDCGKPLLDEAELAEALRACRVAPAHGAPSLTRLEETDVSQLEEELQALRREKRLKTQRLRRLQVLATARSDTALRLASRREDAAAGMRDDLAALGAENAETNGALQALADEVKGLAGFLRVEAPPQGGDGAEPAPAPLLSQGGPAPVFLSQLSLEPYLRQEESNTKTLALYTQKQFFTGITDMVETSSRANFPLVDPGGRAQEDEGAVEARRTEMARLQWAHIVARHQLLHAQAQEQGARAGLQWITQTLRGKAKPCASAQALQMREAGFRQDLRAVEGELEALGRAAVPAAVRESARLLNVPVVRGDLQLQLARQRYYTARQDRVCACLLRQKASFELLRLAQELELREGGRLRGRLEELGGTLGRCDASLRRRLHAFAQPELGLAHAARPCSIIGTRDPAFSRLCKALERDGEVAGGREEPFRTYEGLERAARGRREALRSAREALAGAGRDQAAAAARLEADRDSLHGAAYSGLQHLVLTPQELRGHLQHLEAELGSLNNLMKDMVGEIRGKRAQLEHNRTLRRERDLYVYFHLDDKLLKRVVQDLEGRVCGKGERS